MFTTYIVSAKTQHDYYGDTRPVEFEVSARDKREAIAKARKDAARGDMFFGLGRVSYSARKAEQ